MILKNLIDIQLHELCDTEINQYKLEKLEHFGISIDMIKE